MSPRAPDPRRARTRRAILDAAARLLVEETDEAVSIARIAAAADVSVGSVYVHFVNKEELIGQIVDDALERTAGLFDATRQSDSPLARILAFGDALLEFARAEPVAFRVLTVRTMDPAADGDDAPFGRHLALLERDLQQAMAAGEIADGSPGAALVFLVGAWSGIAAQFVRRDAFSAGPEVAGEVRALGRGLLRTGLRAAA